jgi:hypothetical protein
MNKYSNDFRESLKAASSGLGSGEKFAKLSLEEQSSIISRIDKVLDVARKQNPQNFKYELTKSGHKLF